MYRLHIDVAFGNDQNAAIIYSKGFLEKLGRFLVEEGFGETVKYRLGNDEDRQKSNYLDINENGHVSNHKLTLETSVNKRTA